MRRGDLFGEMTNGRILAKILGFHSTTQITQIAHIEQQHKTHNHTISQNSTITGHSHALELDPQNQQNWCFSTTLQSKVAHTRASRHPLAKQHRSERIVRHWVAAVRASWCHGKRGQSMPSLQLQLIHAGQPHRPAHARR